MVFIILLFNDDIISDSYNSFSILQSGSLSIEKYPGHMIGPGEEHELVPSL